MIVHSTMGREREKERANGCTLIQDLLRKQKENHRLSIDQETAKGLLSI